MKVLALLLLIFMAGPAPGSAEQPVDVELVLAVDVSGSMSYEEHDIQRRGFLAAFADQELLKAIMSGIRGRIAVTYIEWAGPSTNPGAVAHHLRPTERDGVPFPAWRQTSLTDQRYIHFECTRLLGAAFRR